MDAKLKHLEFIQGVINRLAGNLFLLKGWGITLIVGTLALLSSKDANPQAVSIALLPVVTFWILDGYFLSQERLFRALYKDVAGKDGDAIDFSMDTTRFYTGKNTWFRSIFSKTLNIFYGISLIAIGTVGYIGQPVRANEAVHRYGNGSINNSRMALPRGQMYWHWDKANMK